MESSVESEMEWSSAEKCVKTKISNQIVELKQNRSLFARLVTAAKSQPKIDMKQATRNFQMSAVSHSLFAACGSLLPATDKTKLLHILEELPGARANNGTDLTIQQIS